jgi:hypothetical protein
MSHIRQPIYRVCCHVSEYFFQLRDVRIFIQGFRLGFDVWISVVIW